MSVLTMLIGGPGDGEFYEIDYSAPIPYASEPVGRSGAVDYYTYRCETIGFPDYWRIDVFVHGDVDLDSFTEEQFIDIAMRLWREQHRRESASRRLRVPSGSSISEEYLR